MNSRTKRTKTVAAVILAGMLLSACGATAETKSEKGGAAPQQYQDSVRLVTDAYGPLMKIGVTGAAGYYGLQFSSNAKSANLVYTDFATLQRVYLCNKPNCTHQDDACDSFLDNTIGGAYLFTSTDGNRIYYVQRGTEEATESGPQATGKVLAMAADGSERKTLLDLGANGRISDAIAADSKAFYITVNTVENDTADPKRQLLRVDFESGKTQKLLSDLEVGTRIFGAYGSKLILQNQKSTSLSYSAYDLATEKEEELCSWNYDAFEGINLVYGDTLFVLAKQGDGEGTLTRYHFETKATETLDHVPIYAGDSTHFEGFYDKEWLIVSTTDTTNPADIRFLQYGVNVVTGEIKQLTLTYVSNGYEQPIAILADAGADFLVIYDTYPGVINLLEDGVLTNMQSPEAPRLGLISKTDFYANQPNYRPIQDSVISEKQ